jgi:superfamily I DNA/RNA helicase
MQLNEEQTLAVEHPLDEPACLIAGAGSGKTATMTARVKWLIAHGVKPRRIAVITFTNRAAGELVARIGVTDPHSPDSPRVSTIHSLALSAIRKNPLGFGLQERVSPLDDYDQSQMMKKIIEREKITDTNPYAVLEKIQFHRARGVGFVVDYTEEVAEEAERMYSGYHLMSDTDLKLWGLYQTEKTRTNVLDFDDMILLCNRRFATDEDWKRRIQAMWDHVLVDEVQDISKIQWQFIEGLLAPDNFNLFVVGDLNQSIYSFTGAAPYLLKQYSENWRGVVPRMYKIVRNHRSVPEIVRLANVIQSKMGEGSIPLKMESWRGGNGESGKIEILKGVMASEIAADIAVEIFKDNEKFLRDERTRAEGGTPRESQAKPISYRENFILVRAAIQIRDIETELVRRRIPYVVRGGRGLLQTEEVRDVLAYMRLATNHKDFMAFVRAAQVPRRGCGEVALEKIRAIANDKYDGDLIAAAEGDKNAKIASFGGVVRLVTQFSENPVAMLERTRALTQYTTYISDKYKRDSGKVKTKLENLDRFGSLIEGLVADGAMTAEDMIFQLTLDRPKDDDESGAVTISTIHSAKGLEAKRVYVNNVTEGSLPHKFSSGNEEEIREERRLFYVACTRARDYLILCIPALLQQGPNVTNLRPSRFLIEIGVA